MYRYYDERLSAERLKRAYEIAPQRIQQYLEAEMDHVLEKVRPGAAVLDLGCGYGRVLGRLSEAAGLVVGIDTSFSSLILARECVGSLSNCFTLCMDAALLGFRDSVFDCVVCIQNGISAFHVDQRTLISEAVRVTKPGGTALFSTYSDTFWDYRLEWFSLQSEAGLLGEIDYARTRDGLIVCKDGFTATTVRPREFEALTFGVDADVVITEVDGSSVFCEISPRSPDRGL